MSATAATPIKVVSENTKSLLYGEMIFDWLIIPTLNDLVLR